MDRLREVIIKSINDFITEYGQPDEGIEIRSVVDDMHAVFQLLIMGWQGVERIYPVLFHLEINDNKVWVQEDNTENGIAAFLLKNGLLKQTLF